MDRRDLRTLAPYTPHKNLFTQLVISLWLSCLPHNWNRDSLEFPHLLKCSIWPSTLWLATRGWLEKMLHPNIATSHLNWKFRSHQTQSCSSEVSRGKSWLSRPRSLSDRDYEEIGAQAQEISHPAHWNRKRLLHSLSGKEMPLVTFPSQ